MQQTPNAVLSINRLLNSNNFKRIIEIGTFDAGLSTFLALYCFLSRQMPNENTQVSYKIRTSARQPRDFYTFDIAIKDESMTKFVQQIGGKTIIQNVFEEPCVSGLKCIIATEGQTLLICDGGCKKKEIDVYGSALKKGDIVLVHDYSKDDETYENIQKRGIWHAWETKWESKTPDDNGIKDICEKHKIKQIHADEFDDSVWFCGQKI